MLQYPNTKIEQVVVHGNNYILAHEIASQRNDTFQGAVMDEQFVMILAMNNEEDSQAHLESYMDGFDNNYAENTIFFIPHQHVVAAKEKIQKILNEWKDNGDHFLDFYEGVYYIAYKYTPSGMWVFMNENNGQDTFYESFQVFNDVFDVVGVADTDIECNNTTAYVTVSPSESSGPDFFNALVREQDPIVALMLSEGIVFEDVEDYNEEDD